METVAFGIIGYGAIARNYHLPAIAKVPQARLLAVADIVEDRARECAQEYDIPDVYTDYGRIIEREDIDAVLLLTCCDVHLEVVSAAAETGKHVFMQKPFAPTVEEGRKIVEVAKKAGIRVVTSFMHRYLDEVVKAGEMIRAGAVGKIEMIRHRNAIGSNYNNAVRLGGGVMDIGPHGVDLVRFYSGQRIIKVSALMDCWLGGREAKVEPKWGRAVDMAATMNYELAEGVPASHEVHWTQRGGQGRFMSEIYGDEGTLFVRAMFADKMLAYAKGNKVEYPDYEERPLGVLHHQTFVEDILNDTQNSASPEEGLEVLCVTEAAYQSAQNGGAPVPVQI